jgi:NADH-quinone oxidoreductase subunit C
MNPQEIGSRLAALLAPGEPVTEPGQAPRDTPGGTAPAATTPGAGEGPLDAPTAERAADAVSEQERAESTTPRTDTAGGPTTVDDEREARIRRAQEARAARAAAAEGAPAAGGEDERGARIRRAQEARAARTAAGGGRPARATAPAAKQDSAVRTAGDLSLSVSGGGDHARATVDVPPAKWAEAIRAVRDDADLACDFFDWLSAVDELDEGYTVVAHLWSTTKRHGLLLRTRVSKAAPEVASIVDVFPGAAWHERETYEMFGIGFAGHADLKPLLLPPEFVGHPMRKDFILASRVAKAWPGAKEPGESEGGGAKRAPMRPPGVPAPGEWGPA